MRNRESFKAFVDKMTSWYGTRWDASELDSRFVRHFESGERIRVRTCGEELTGTVGVTGGWRPCFLLMRTSRSIGSPWTLGPKDEILAVQKGRAYIYGAA